MHGKRPIPPAVGRIFEDPHGTLAALRRQARTLQELEEAIADALPGQLAGQWRLAAAGGQQARLIAYSSAWATQLRFSETAIRTALTRCGLHGIRRVSVRVAAPPPAPRPPQPSRNLSEVARRCLESAARTQTDPNLAAAFLRLARHGDAQDRAAGLHGEAGIGTD